LKELRIYYLADPTVLTAIGKNLISLELGSPNEKVVDGIIKHCPNLEYLLKDVKFDDEVKDGMVRSIKSGLKKLAKFKLDDISIRLGTDWEGHL
jgi:hypothetical protein